MEIFVVVDAVIEDYNVYHETHQAISRRLAAFLDPITGNFNGQGWEIGQLPGREVVYNSIKTVKNIKWIRGGQMGISGAKRRPGGGTAYEHRAGKQSGSPAL